MATHGSLYDDAPLAMDDAEPALTREILSGNRGVRHRNPKLLSQEFQG